MGRKRIWLNPKIIRNHSRNPAMSRQKLRISQKTIKNYWKNPASGRRSSLWKRKRYPLILSDSAMRRAVFRCLRLHFRSWIKKSSSPGWINVILTITLCFLGLRLTAWMLTAVCLIRWQSVHIKMEKLHLFWQIIWRTKSWRPGCQEH